MSNPVVTGCKLPVFANPTCQNQPTTYLSAQQTVSCPVGFSGGPFISVLGKFTSTISQADADSQATAYLNNLLSTNCIQTIFPPVVSNGSLTVAPSGAVNYQIVATNSPTSYGATGLPAGLSINTSTGIISGNVPATLTTYSIPISATNVAGTGHGILTINVKTPITIGFSLGISPLPSVAEVSIDGASYATIVDLTNYPALSQIKFRWTITPGTYSPWTVADINDSLSNPGARPLILGSQSTANGIVIPSSGSSDALGVVWPTYSGGGGQTLNNGTFNYFTDLTGIVLPAGGGNSNRMRLLTVTDPSPSYNFVSTVFETILNF